MPPFSFLLYCATNCVSLISTFSVSQAFSAAEKREFLGIWRAERETKDRSEEDHNLGVTLTHEVRFVAALDHFQ